MKDLRFKIGSRMKRICTVSYTHLDVYKRQANCQPQKNYGKEGSEIILDNSAATTPRNMRTMTTVGTWLVEDNALNAVSANHFLEVLMDIRMPVMEGLPHLCGSPSFDHLFYL